MSTPIRYMNFEGLVNMNTSGFLMKDTELVAAKNVYMNKVGQLEKVPGYELAVNDQIVNDKSVNYLHYYYQPSTDTSRLIGGSDSGTNYILEYRTTGNWTTLSATYTSRAGAEVSMQNYLDKVFIVGYDSGTFLAPATIEGTTYTASAVTDTDLDSMPGGKYIVRYRDLLYVLNAYVSSPKPNRAYYCDDPVEGAITWSNLTNFIDFGYDDGDEITGGASALDRLIVFKRYSMWKYDEYERKQIAQVGCDSYRSIISLGDALYWFNRDGFWRWTGNTPELISYKVQPLINAMVATTLGNVVATVHDGFEYRAFIGTVTVEGNTYTNAWYCFDTRTENQYIRCTYDTATSACEYIESSKKRAYFGNNDGYVMKFSTAVDGVYSDNTNAISSFFTTKPYDHGVPEETKFTNHLTFFSENPQGMVLSVDSNNQGEFSGERHCVLKKSVETTDVSLSGNIFRYKFSETGTGKSWKFFGFVAETDVIDTSK